MTGSDHDACPACGAGTGAEQWCGVCGLDLRSDAAGGLRNLAGRLAATEVELASVAARRDALASALAQRRWESDRRAPMPAPDVPVFRPFARPGAGTHTPEWGVERVRNLLLWTGATLLALSALAFTAVAWTHLGPGGRATLLIAFTVVSAVMASALRSRLPATAGAFTGLTIALALIDWQVVRRAGVAPGMSTKAWWAIGTAAVGGLSAALGRIAAPVPARRAIALLLPVSAVLAIAANASASWGVALELALLAAAIVAVLRFLAPRSDDQIVAATLRLGAGAVWFGGALYALDAAIVPTRFIDTVLPAAVMLAFALAPGMAARPARGSSDPIDRVPMAFRVFAAVIGAALTLASASIGSIGMLTLAAVLGGFAIVVAPHLASTWSRAANAAGIASGAAGFVFAASGAAVAVFGPLAWFADAWTGNTGARAVRVVGGPQSNDVAGLGWCAVAILMVTAGAIALTARPRTSARRALDTPTRQAAAVGFVLLAIALAPIAAGASALATCAVTTGATALAILGAAIVATRDDRRALTSGLLVVVTAIPTAGWATLTRTTSVAVLATVMISALAAAVIGRSAWLRATHAGIGASAAITLAAVSLLAADRARPSAAFAALIVAGVVMVVGSLARKDTADGLLLEIVGTTGMIVGVTLAVPSVTWVGAGLTAMVPLLLVASVRRDRTYLYATAAGGAALGATWVWLAAADVKMVEAYTLPAAVIAFAVGTLAWKTGRARSWLNLGPACAIALGPTLALAIVRNDDARAVTVGIAGLAVLLLGAWRRLQAPIVLGAVTLVVLGIDKIGPQAVRLPRWTVLAIAGALLLWVGTTFERRRDDVQRAARRLGDLG